MERLNFSTLLTRLPRLLGILRYNIRPNVSVLEVNEIAVMRWIISRIEGARRELKTDSRPYPPPNTYSHHELPFVLSYNSTFCSQRITILYRYFISRKWSLLTSSYVLWRSPFWGLLKPFKLTLSAAATLETVLCSSSFRKALLIRPR